MRFGVARRADRAGGGPAARLLGAVRSSREIPGAATEILVLKPIGIGSLMLAAPLLAELRATGAAVHVLSEAAEVFGGAIVPHRTLPRRRFPLVLDLEAASAA